MTNVILASGTRAAPVAPVVTPASSIGDTAGDIVSGLIPEPVSRFFAVVGDGAVWKRIGVIGLGIWLVYIGVLIWIASNENTRQAVTAVAGAIATRNPSALTAAV